MPGNRFHNKKNLLNQFVKSYDFTYVDFGPKLIEQAMAMQEDWCTWRDCESSDLLAAENRAILRVLDHWDRFDRIMGGALFVDNIIVAYTLAEPLTADTLVIHFEKGCPAYKGGYQAINQMFLAHAGRRVPLRQPRAGPRQRGAAQGQAVLQPGRLSAQSRR
ncbi:MAG: phosphatidylglycerol lysyltransferase domain-containing protein [Desulfobacterales bacterium]|nr:phosphatidylglycerol lysyltransferase domain-containing protein [Desulfobacterales bacterium]